MPPTAWMISNRQPYAEEIERPDSLLLAGPQLLGRFTTTPLAKGFGRGGGGGGGGEGPVAAGGGGCCNITRLGPGACVETAEATERIKHHLEAVLDRRLQVHTYTVFRIGACLRGVWFDFFFLRNYWISVWTWFG